MARAHEVAIGADGRAFNQAIKNDIIKPVDDAARSLDELADAGEDAGRDGSRGLDDIKDSLKDVDRASDDAKSALVDVEDAAKDAGRDGSRDIGKLEDALREAERQSDNLDRSVEDVGDQGETSFRKLGDTGAEVGGELRQNLGETFSSFRGDLEDLPQIAQDTLGGLAGSGALGGIPGLAATAAGAAGLGLIIGAMEQIREEQALSEEAVAGWADAYLESGNRVIGAAEVIGGVVSIATDPERYKIAAENARNWGVDVTTAMRAMSGDAAALNVVQDSVTTMQEEWNEITAAGGESADDYAAKTQNLTDDQIALRDQLFAGGEAFRELTGEMKAGQDRARLVSDALIGIVNDAGSATVEVDELGNKLYTLPDNTQVMVDADTGLATQNVDDFKGDLDGIPETVTSKVKVSVDDSAWRRWKPNPKTGTINARVTGRVPV